MQCDAHNRQTLQRKTLHPSSGYKRYVLPKYTASHPSTLSSLESSLWGPQSHKKVTNNSSHKYDTEPQISVMAMQMAIKIQTATYTLN
jgi:hypothetical protein